MEKGLWKELQNKKIVGYRRSFKDNPINVHDQRLGDPQVMVQKHDVNIQEKKT